MNNTNEKFKIFLIFLQSKVEPSTGLEPAQSGVADRPLIPFRHEGIKLVAPAGFEPGDLVIKSHLLYQLS